MFACTLLATILILILRFYWKHQRFVRSLPPGPPPNFFFGNLLQLDRRDPRKTFLKWHKKYGPIFTFWNGHAPRIMITGHELMHELFVKRADEFSDRPPSFLFEKLIRGMYGISSANGDMWKEQRRFSLHVLRSFGLGQNVMQEKIQAECAKLIAEIERILSMNGGKNLHFLPLLEICVGNIISSIIFGRMYDFDDEKFIARKYGLDRLIYLLTTVPNRILDSFPWLRFVPFYEMLGYNELMMENDKILNFLSSEIAQHKSALNVHSDSEPTDFTEAYLLEMKRRQKSGAGMSWFNDWQLTCILYDLWGPGIETTASTLDWMILLMMHNQDVQKKVQKEIQNVIGFERMPNMNDRLKMPYTSATIQELQRYANVLTVNVSHSCQKDVVVEGYTIPSGVPIIPHITVVHMDDTIYSDPSAFNPDRFLEDDKTMLKKNDMTLMPFSLGKRICLGEGLARMELFIILTFLLQNFSFTFVGDEPIPDLTPVVSLTSHPKLYNVCITRVIDV